MLLAACDYILINLCWFEINVHLILPLSWIICLLNYLHLRLLITQSTLLYLSLMEFVLNKFQISFKLKFFIWLKTSWKFTFWNFSFKYKLRWVEIITFHLQNVSTTQTLKTSIYDDWIFYGLCSIIMIKICRWFSSTAVMCINIPKSFHQSFIAFMVLNFRLLRCSITILNQWAQLKYMKLWALNCYRNNFHVKRFSFSCFQLDDS